MPTPTLANVPQNQRDALPIMQSGGTNGTVDVLGGVVVRKWTAAQTGIASASVTTDANGHVYCVTSFLDTSGCRSFTALMLRGTTPAGSLLATPAMLVQFQMRIDAADVPPTSLPGGSINLPFCGMSPVNTTGLTWPALNDDAEVQRALRCWDLAEIMGNAGTVGSQQADARFFLSFGTSAVSADNKFTVVLWGTS